MTFNLYRASKQTENPIKKVEINSLEDLKKLQEKETARCIRYNTAHPTSSRMFINPTLIVDMEDMEITIYDWYLG